MYFTSHGCYSLSTMFSSFIPMLSLFLFLLLVAVGCWLLVVGWLVGWLAGWLAGWLVGWLVGCCGGGCCCSCSFSSCCCCLFVCFLLTCLSYSVLPGRMIRTDDHFFGGGRDLGNQYPIESPDCLLALMLSLGIFIAQPGLLFWVFLKWGHVQIIHINRSFCKPSILW